MEKSLTLGVGDKQPRWRLLKNTVGVLWGGPQFFHPNTLWGKQGTQTSLDGLASLKLAGIEKHFPATSTGICLSFDEIGGS